MAKSRIQIHQNLDVPILILYPTKLAHSPTNKAGAYLQ